jgi:hypothetical protein
MLKSLSALEVKIGERAYKLICEGDSPLGEVHDVLCKMKSFVIEKILAAQKSEEKPEEPAA